MAHVSDLIATDIEAYLKSHQYKSLLRFITCGSVDDGKSTLIGRLLYESKMLFEDQLAAVEADSKKFGTQGDQIDFALLVDGLAAEREQGITIDVAYRFFSTDKRKFIVADTPGHEQYTRNMVTGASTADVAVLMIDARKGVLTQTRRHSYLVNLLGIRHVVLAINKMDLMDYRQDVFDRIVAEYKTFAAQIGVAGITPIPMSAFKGDNITETSANMPWYKAPHYNAITLMNFLETVSIDEDRARKAPFRLPVQWVNRPNLDFRGFAGTVAGGVVKVGDRIVAQPSGRESTVKRIVTMGGDLQEAVAGQSVTLTLADEIDISRGDVVSLANAPAPVADRFDVTLVWMHDEPMHPGRPYLLKIGARTVNATVTAIGAQINVNSLERSTADLLELNGIAECTLNLDRRIGFDPYTDNRDTGGFILIDRLSNNTVGAGLIAGAARAVAGSQDIDRAAREAMKGQIAEIIRVEGGLAAARMLERQLHAEGRHTYVLDASVAKNADEIAAALVDAGIIVLIANAR
ncbi:MAG: sulfate adenylyltransferase subunit CysN [Pseudomonadota bacterium]